MFNAGDTEKAIGAIGGNQQSQGDSSHMLSPHQFPGKPASPVPDAAAGAEEAAGGAAVGGEAAAGAGGLADLALLAL